MRRVESLHCKVAAHNLCRTLETFPPTGDMGWDDNYVGGSFFSGFGQCIPRAGADMAAGQHAHPDACSLAAVRPPADDGMFLVAYLG